MRKRINKSWVVEFEFDIHFICLGVYWDNNLIAFYFPFLYLEFKR